MKHLLALVVVLSCCTASQPADPERKIDFETLLRPKVSGSVVVCGEKLIIIQQSRPNKGVVTYPLHDRLASGKVNLLASDSYSYRAKDVEIGDLVTLHLEKENNEEYCVSIQIGERPKSTVPPSQKPEGWRPYHIQKNASIAEKLYGIPQPGYLSPLAREVHYPAFDPNIPKAKRIKRFPHDNPMSYMEYLMFMR